MEAAEVKVEEIKEEEEGGRVVERNLTMISSMLGHTRLPGQQDDELLDVMLVGTVGDVEQDGGSHSGADLLTGVFFSLLAFSWFLQYALARRRSNFSSSSASSSSSSSPPSL